MVAGMARQIRRALISVYDKTGIAEFARALVEEFGIDILSTGGTARLLQNEGIPVTLVEAVTGSGEMLDGRVKTLHPNIHGAILADRDNPEHMGQLEEHGIEPIDMVVVNLYPFEKTVAEPGCTKEQAIEMIDIGGPCLLRAAAKNHRHVLVVSGSAEYGLTLDRLRNWSDEATRADALSAGAFGAFQSTCGYDAEIAQWLSDRDESGASVFKVQGHYRRGRTRYGENPHQQGEVLKPIDGHAEFDLTTAGAERRGGGELSFNNYADASAALELCAELSRAFGGACCVFVKHTNSCGVAVHEDRVEVYRKAYLGDPNAAMGGVLAVNFHVDAAFAEAVMETYQRWGKPLKQAKRGGGPGAFFVEVWVAPSFDEEAVNVIRTRKKWGERVRLLELGDMSIEPDAGELDRKRIAGGLLVQTRDLVGLDEELWKVVTKRRPTDVEMADLRLAWLVCKHTKSNAITICKDGMLLGNGAGQMSRVMSCRIATWLAEENGHGEALTGSVAASDAFFPFRDGPEGLMEAGVRAIIQPGGSKRDSDTVAACDEREVAMVFTGTRHFKH